MTDKPQTTPSAVIKLNLPLKTRASLAALELDKLGNYILGLDSESPEGKLHKKSANVIRELAAAL